MRTQKGWKRPPRWQIAIAVVAVAGLTGFGTVRGNVLNAADRLERLAGRIEAFVDPPPHRPTVPTVVVTPQPSQLLTAKTGTAREVASRDLVDPRAVSSRGAVPSQAAAPERTPVNVTLVDDHNAVFARQLTDKWCAVAATQMVLAILGLGDTSDAFQHEIAAGIDDWESWEDSHNGGWGPAAVAEALAAYGAPDYEIRAYATYTDALRDSAIAISQMGKPVVMFPWWGAHTWVMTGYRADADPTLFADAHISGAYILDPWYPRHSSIWGPSDAPGNFEDLAELERNWPAYQGPPGYEQIGPGWTRPEGAYPDRDGKFVVLVPTTPRGG